MTRGLSRLEARHDREHAGLDVGDGTVLVPNARNWRVLIDEEDAERVFAHRWTVYGDGSQYSCSRAKWIEGKLRREPLSRFILGTRAGHVVDHINGDRLDNRRANLRFATSAENARNMRAQYGRASPYKGVARSISRVRPWRAYIYLNLKQVFLGGYATPEEAARAYDAAARLNWGEHAALNFAEPGEISALRLVEPVHIGGTFTHG